jgi:hypothetical protein
MKRILIIISLIIIISPSAKANDFREVSWGMTKLEVLSTEDLNPLSFKGSYVIYETYVAEKKMLIVYEFLYNTLIKASYTFKTKDKDDYEKYHDILSEKYGSPTFDLDYNPLDYRYKWETGSTRVFFRPGKKRTCRIDYESKDYEYLREKKKNRERTLYETEVADNF